MEKLLRLLSENSSYTVKELALLTGESEESVNGKINEYFDQGIIKGYKAAINWEKVKDAGVTAYIELKVTPQRDRGFEKVAERIANYPEVKDMYLMSGAYDLLVTVEGKSLKEVAMFVSERLAPMESVVSTATHFELKTYKKDGILFTEKEEDNREVISI